MVEICLRPFGNSPFVCKNTEDNSQEPHSTNRPLLSILGWPPKFSLKFHSEGWMSGEGEGKHLRED